MRTISEKDLIRLKNKGGVSIRRRFGTKKKPGPKATEAKALSGAKAPETSVPASDIHNGFKAVASEEKRLKGLIDVNFNLIKQLKESFESLKADFIKPKVIEDWTHTINRDSNTGLIKTIVSSTPTKIFMHTLHRTQKGIVNSISTSQVNNPTGEK